MGNYVKNQNYKDVKKIKNFYVDKFNNLINSISENIEKFHFNKSVANIYEYVNEINRSMDKNTISIDNLKCG